MGVFSWVSIIISIKSYSRILKGSNILKLFIFFLIIIWYLLIVALINNQTMIIAYSYYIYLIDIIPCSIFITRYCLRKNYSIKDLINLLLIVGNIQGLISLLSFLFPAFQQIILNRMLSYGFTDVILSLSDHRIYGLSYNMTYAMPIVQGVLAVLALYMAVTFRTKYFLLVPLLVLSGVINARTSLIIILVGVIFILSTMYKSFGKKIIRLFLVSLTTMISIIIIIKVINYYSSDTFYWVETGFNEITLFLFGQNTGYFKYISNSSFYQIPDGLFFLIGKGHTVTRTFMVATDIGYINDIWLGGLIYCIISYASFMLIFISIYRSKTEDKISIKVISLFLLTTFLISNIKGIIISVNEFINMLFLIEIFLVLYSKANEQEIDKLIPILKKETL